VAQRTAETTGKAQQAYPENENDDFYVLCDACILCAAPHDEAPDLMGWHERDEPPGPRTCAPTHCFFKAQPRTPDEIERAIRAMNVSCVEALRYGGLDPRILLRLHELGLEHLCDHPLTEEERNRRTADKKARPI
jgi:hypothetical protein